MVVFVENIAGYRAGAHNLYEKNSNGVSGILLLWTLLCMTVCTSSKENKPEESKKTGETTKPETEFTYQRRGPVDFIDWMELLVNRLPHNAIPFRDRKNKEIVYVTYINTGIALWENYNRLLF